MSLFCPPQIHRKPFGGQETLCRHIGGPRWFQCALPVAALFLVNSTLAAQAALTTTMPTAPDLPDTGLYLVRVAAALAIVLGLFFGGIWLFKNWQRLVLQKGQTAKLQVLEVRPLGNRHALYVIGYERERLLLAASPTGVSLLSHLPPGAPLAPAQAPAAFAQSLQQAIQRKE